MSGPPFRIVGMRPFDSWSKQWRAMQESRENPAKKFLFSRTGDAVHLRILVMKEKETVMVLVMEVNMMVIEVANKVLFAEVTIAENLVFIIMKRMTVARSLHRR